MSGFIVEGIKWTAAKLSSLLPSVATAASSSSTSSEAHKDLKKLESTMTRIQAMLTDAHDRDIGDHSVKLRLNELKQVALDAEDVVDDYGYDVQHAEIQSGNRMLGLVGGSGQKRKRQEEEEAIDSDSISVSIPVSEEISHRVKDIRERFEEITAEWKTLRLRQSDAPRRTNDSTTFARPPTSSLVQESTIYGRDEDKENIIKQLLNSSSTDSMLKVVSIVGMGGIGKTTLAQLVYNDARVVQHFELKGWVCVSQDFNVVTLTKNIISSFTKGNCELSELDSLHHYLQEEVRGKRFLLVLDDMWNDNPTLWHSLRVPLISARSGTVLVTARNIRVATIMQTENPYALKLLKFDDCWSLFKQIVFDREDRDVDEHRIEIAKKIVDRCGRLPLAVKAIGGVLRYEYHIESWNDILESKELGSNDRNGNFLPVLKLSYDHMPSHLKECFAFFALLPRGYYFLEDNIIKLWMSMGLIRTDSSEKKVEAGRVYINELQERSMIQPHIQSSEKQRAFIIHDLLRELAQQEVGDEFLITELNNNDDDENNNNNYHKKICSPKKVGMGLITEPKSNFNMFDSQTQVSGQLSGIIRSPSYPAHKYMLRLQYLHQLNAQPEIPSQLSAKVRYISYLTPEVMEDIPKFHGSTKLRVVMVLDSYQKVVICKMFDKFRFLRALNLSYSRNSKLPESIGNLKQLRYLNLSESGLNILPDSICSLYNLETLELTGCPIVELPKAIGNLKQLRYLHLSESGLNILPDSICSLYNLETLELTGCPIVRLPEAIGQLRKLQHLSYSSQNLRFLPYGIELLTNLRTLQDFVVGNDDSDYCFGKLKFLAHLTELHITRLGNVTNTKNIGDHLLRKQSLQHLTLDWTCDGCVRVKNIECRILVKQSDEYALELRRQIQQDVLRSLKPNPYLEQLTINMYAGSKFPLWVGDISFNRLVEVQLNYFLCEFLPPLGQLPALKFLTCKGGKNVCQVGRELFGYRAKTLGFKSLEKLEFYGMERWEQWSGVDGRDFAKLHFLLICNCPELVFLPSPLSSTLTSMKIVYCEKLSRIPTLPSLTYLYLAGQVDEKLLFHSHLPQLITLELSCVDKTPHLDINSRSFPSLEVLKIRGCKDLESLVGLSSLTILKELSIRKCPRLYIHQDKQFPTSLEVVSYDISERRNISSLYIKEEMSDSSEVLQQHYGLS